MALTLTGISQATGATGGRYLVRVTGTDFPVPPVPVSNGAPAPEPAQTFGLAVADVTGAFRLCTDVAVLSPTEAIGVMPTGAAGAATIVVANFTTSEVAFAANLFAYVLPDLTKAVDRPVLRVVEQLVTDLRREVTKNVSVTTSADYDGTPGDGLNIITNAELPHVVLVGPTTNENRFHSLNARRTKVTGNTTWAQFRPATTVDLSFEVVVVADASTEAMALMHEVVAFFERNIFLTITVNALTTPANPGDDTASYEMDMVSSFEGLGEPNASNLRQLSGKIVIRGIDIDDQNPLVGQGATLTDDTQILGTEPRS